MNVFVTGGTGFLGFNTICRLLSGGHRVYALVRRPDSILAKISDDNLTLIKGDLQSLPEQPLLPIDVCVHMAWGGVNRDGVNNLDIQKQNIINNLMVVDYLKRCHCKMLIDTGSRQEYSPNHGIITEDSPCNPVSEYGKWKLEAYHKTLVRVDDMRYVHLRIFSTFGFGDHPWSLINTCIDKSLRNEPIALGQCRHFWSFLYISDFSEAIYQIVMKLDELNENKIYNLASGFIQPLRYFVNSIRILTKSSSDLRFGEFKENKESVYPLIPDVSKINEEIGWYERTAFADGIKTIINKKSYGKGK